MIRLADRAGDQELADRVGAVDELFDFGKLADSKRAEAFVGGSPVRSQKLSDLVQGEADAGVQAEFPAGAAIAAELEALIRLEAQCCAFALPAGDVGLADLDVVAVGRAGQPRPIRRAPLIDPDPLSEDRAGSLPASASIAACRPLTACWIPRRRRRLPRASALMWVPAVASGDQPAIVGDPADVRSHDLVAGGRAQRFGQPDGAAPGRTTVTSAVIEMSEIRRVMMRVNGWA
jgi:hypothetical protein